MDILNYFNVGLAPDEEFIVDLDTVLAAIMSAAKTSTQGANLIKKTIVPQLIAMVYQKLCAAVGKVECYLRESSAHERHVFTVIYDDVETDAEVIETKFFFELVFAIHRVGMGELDVCNVNEEVSYEMLIQFIERHLMVEIPDQLKDGDVMDVFMRKNVINLRRAKKNDDRIDRLLPTDLSQLQSIYIKQYLTLKDSFVHTARAAHTLIKLRHTIFEPIFSHYKNTDGYLSLTGTFYSCLLFISKCNVATSFIDANIQQKAFETINKRTRQLITTLKNQN